MAKEQRTHERQRKENKSRDLFSRAQTDQPLQDGIIVGRFGQEADVQDDEGHIFRCHLRKHLKTIAVGDEVEWYPDATGSAVVVNVKPRRSQLERPNPYEGLKIIAANIFHILIIVAPLPAFSETLLDRYLVAAELTDIPVSIVVNKTDLLEEHTKMDLQQRLRCYVQLGYPLFWVSRKSGEGMQLLREHMSDGCSVLVGQSGVGKSSLLNALVPDAHSDVGDVSESSDLGQHTTSASRLYRLPNGGTIIDSPGVREFGLWHLSAQNIAKGFVDIRRISERCKFRNCMHDREPQCAVRDAAESGELPASRWQSFKAILASLNTV